MSTSDQGNRRKYFRIIDKSSVCIVPLAPGLEPEDAFPELSSEFKLLAEFQALEIESRSLFRQILQKNRELGSYLSLLNKKQDLLSQVLAFQALPIKTEDLHNISLSEGGMSVFWRTPFNENERVAIQLILMPEHHGLLIAGRIQRSTQENGHWDIHIEFESLSEAKRQLLSKHILRSQSRQKNLQQ